MASRYTFIQSINVVVTRCPRLCFLKSVTTSGVQEKHTPTERKSKEKGAWCNEMWTLHGPRNIDEMWGVLGVLGSLKMAPCWITKDHPRTLMVTFHSSHTSKLTVCYWKSSFIDDYLIKMVIVYSSVSLLDSKWKNLGALMAAGWRSDTKSHTLGI